MQEQVADEEPDHYMPFLIGQMANGPRQEKEAYAALDRASSTPSNRRWIRYSAPEWVEKLPIPPSLGDMYDIQTLRRHFESTKSDHPSNLPVIAKLAYVYTVARSLDALDNARGGPVDNGQMPLDEAYTKALGKLGGRIDYDLATAFEANPAIAEGVRIQYRDGRNTHVSSCRDSLVVCNGRLMVRGNDGEVKVLDESVRRSLVLGAVGLVRSRKVSSQEDDNGLPALKIVENPEGTALMKDIRDLARARTVELCKTQWMRANSTDDAEQIARKLGWAIPGTSVEINPSSPSASDEPLSSATADSAPVSALQSDTTDAAPSPTGGKQPGRRWLSRLTAWRPNKSPGSKPGQPTPSLSESDPLSNTMQQPPSQAAIESNDDQPPAEQHGTPFPGAEDGPYTKQYELGLPPRETTLTWDWGDWARALGTAGIRKSGMNPTITPPRSTGTPSGASTVASARQEAAQLPIQSGVDRLSTAYWNNQAPD